MNRAGSWGKDALPGRHRRSASAVCVHLAKVLTVEPGGHRRLRVQMFADDGQPVPSVVPVYPSRTTTSARPTTCSASSSRATRTSSAS